MLAIVHQPDAGPGVFAQAIAARGHELEVWQPAEGEPAPEDPSGYAGVISLGGGMNPDQEDAHPWLAREKRLLSSLLEQEVPLLGVCLGAQLLAEAAGAVTRRASSPEIGWYTVRTLDHASRDPLLQRLPSRFPALHWHSYEFALPPGAAALAASDVCLQAYRVRERAWGIQFHAEVTLEMFASWLSDYRSDSDAVALGVEPDRLMAQTRATIGDWNRLGRGLCARFVHVAEMASGVRQRRSG